MEDDTDNQARKSQCKTFCKKFIKFLFSHIGLCAMVAAYCVAGGFIFEHLESTNEKEECIRAMDAYMPMENSTKHKMWDVAKTYGKDANDEEKASQAIQEYQGLLEKFMKDVIELGYDGKNCTIMGEPNGPGYAWSYPGSLLFSVTVVTTIGYGNIAPKTYWGRLVCIAYSVLGIPLMLLCLANIGDVMADIFRYVYSKICCCGCCRRKDKKPKEEPQPRTDSPDAWKEDFNRTGGAPGGPEIIDDDEDDEDEDDYQDISVPLTVTLAVIAFYIFMGAMLFATWEDWKKLDAAYFCFITISTIGFGDLVPGSDNFATRSGQLKMILAALYTLFGLALLSMCFSLIQEEIATKFRWLGEKLGLVQKDKSDDDDDDDGDVEEDEIDREKKKHKE